MRRIFLSTAGVWSILDFWEERGKGSHTHLCHNSSVSLRANSVCLATSCSASRLEIQDASSPFPRDAQKLVSPLFPFPLFPPLGNYHLLLLLRRKKTKDASCFSASKIHQLCRCTIFSKTRNKFFTIFFIVWKTVSWAISALFDAAERRKRKKKR